MIPDPIIVVGPPRSGTSLTAGVLAACGAWYGGDDVNKDSDNQRGYFENVVLASYAHNCLLALDSRRFSLYNEWFENAGDVKSKIQERFEVTNAPWFIKNVFLLHDDKIGSAWSLWAEHFPDAKWIIVRRSLKDTFASQDKKQASPQQYERQWRGKVKFDNMRQMLREIKTMKESGVNFYEIWPFQSLGQDLQKLRDLVHWAGLEWNDHAVRDFVDISLCHHDSEGSLREPGVSQSL